MMNGQDFLGKSTIRELVFVHDSVILIFIDVTRPVADRGYFRIVCWSGFPDEIVYYGNIHLLSFLFKSTVIRHSTLTFLSFLLFTLLVPSPKL